MSHCQQEQELDGQKESHDPSGFATFHPFSMCHTLQSNLSSAKSMQSGNGILCKPLAHPRNNTRSLT